MIANATSSITSNGNSCRRFVLNSAVIVSERKPQHWTTEVRQAIIVIQSYTTLWITPGVDNSAGPMRVLGVSGQFGPPVLIFYWPDRPLVSTSYNGIIHHGIVLYSFHQLVLITQQLNIICDSVDSRYQSKLVTILFTNCKFSITSHGVTTGDVRRRREAHTSPS